MVCQVADFVTVAVHDVTTEVGHSTPMIDPDFEMTVMLS